MPKRFHLFLSIIIHVRNYKNIISILYAPWPVFDTKTDYALLHW